MTSRTRLERKQVDDVLGGEETWKDADQTESTPPSSSEIVCVGFANLVKNNAIDAIQIEPIIVSCRSVLLTSP